MAGFFDSIGSIFGTKKEGETGESTNTSSQPSTNTSSEQENKPQSPTVGGKRKRKTSKKGGKNKKNKRKGIKCGKTSKKQ